MALENRRSGLFVHEYDDVATYEQAVEHVTRVALNPKTSKMLLRKTAKSVAAVDY
ncbi:hypothetical protein [Saccharopolyspora sp. 5N708]|uniref:hypothetical protein n=1 Tax=Saccharopolyspora sp. 5N708 TaxID=3457424 RepID=UPI003FD50B3F